MFMDCMQGVQSIIHTQDSTRTAPSACVAPQVVHTHAVLLTGLLELLGNERGREGRGNRTRGRMRPSSTATPLPRAGAGPGHGQNEAQQYRHPTAPAQVLGLAMGRMRPSSTATPLPPRRCWAWRGIGWCRSARAARTRWC